MSFDVALPVIFMALMGLSMLVYVISDGYDLGVGVLMHRATPAEKDLMIASIGPFGDANETWLVLGVGILLVAFPRTHGLVLGELYLPVALMLVGLTLRGVAFDFRVKAKDTHKQTWDPLLRWLDTGVDVAGLDARPLRQRIRHGLELPAVRRSDRAGAADGLCANGRGLTDHEDRRRAAGARHRLGAHRLGADGRRAGVDLDGHALDQRVGARRWFALPEFIALTAIPLMTSVALLEIAACCDPARCAARCAGCLLPC
jgi:cytochrome d ubiquinol oxidase subunit II